ncbi:MAG: efflux RND transporter periplasmic adaptor subunit, partial [Thermodesulfovibrionales bacterium]|nr:efflux RND transporter periplasmic adaptor subunit [Thermodesulfovibrionales bacterium]
MNYLSKCYQQLSFNKFSLILCLSVIFIFASTGCKDGKDAKQQTERAINVSISKAQKKAIRPYIEAIGTVNPFDEAIVSAEVDGIIKKVNVEEGKAVNKGMVLAEIDDTDFVLDVRRSEAQLKQAQATLANTKIEFDRKKALLKDELITKQQYDDVEMRLNIAEAELEKAKATLNLSRQRLSKTKIYASLSGYVKSKKVTSGDFVRTGSPLFSLIQNNPVKIIFNINERDISKVKVNQEVIFTVDSMPGKEFKARVYTVYPNLDDKLRTLTIEARTNNEDGLLKPGIFTKVIVYTCLLYTSPSPR